MINIFELPGPKTVFDEYGPEPTLGEIVLLYYLESGMKPEKARRCAKQYIDGWMKLHEGVDRPAT